MEMLALKVLLFSEPILAYKKSNNSFPAPILLRSGTVQLSAIPKHKGVLKGPHFVGVEEIKELVGGILKPTGAPVAQWVKRWPTDLADRVRSSLEMKSSQP